MATLKRFRVLWAECTKQLFSDLHLKASHPFSWMVVEHVMRHSQGFRSSLYTRNNLTQAWKVHRTFADLDGRPDLDEGTITTISTDFKDCCLIESLEENVCTEYVRL